MPSRIKSITIVLETYTKVGSGELTDVTSRTIEWDRESKRWIGQDGMYPWEVDLAHRIDRVKGEWST